MAEVADLSDVQDGETLTTGGGTYQFNVNGTGTAYVEHDGTAGETMTAVNLYQETFAPGTLTFYKDAGVTLKVIGMRD